MAVDFRPAESEFVSQAFDEAQDFKANELGTVARFRDVGDTDYGSANFKYVQYLAESAGASFAAAGHMTYYDADTGGTNNQVTTDVSASSEIGAGLLHSAPTNEQYVWVQQTGVATALVITAGADKQGLTGTGAADGGFDQPTALTDSLCAACVDYSEKLIQLQCF